MTEADKQQVALDVLKSFNAAVTTTKLYPPNFPQVVAAEESAFEQIAAFLKRYGSISFSLIEDEPRLCGLPVSQKTLGKVPGQEIFQQLRLLNLEHVMLEKGLSRKLFGQLLIFFTTSPQLINKEGGGRSFVVNLGLIDFFPTEYAFDIPEEREDKFAAVLAQLREDKRVRAENIHTISNEIDVETVAGKKKISSLALLKREPIRVVDLIIAGICDALKGMQRSGAIFFPAAFGTVLDNVDKFAEEIERDEFAQNSALACLVHFDEFSLKNLLLQSYPDGFGDLFYQRLLALLTKKFDAIVALMLEERDVIGENAGLTSGQYRKISAGIERLLATDIGKQYLVRDKAKRLLKVGEKERQAKRIQAGVSAILKGDVSKLHNREVVEHLPATIESLISRGKDRAAAAIIEKITNEIVKGDAATSDMLSESLILIGERLINTDKWGWLEKVSVPLMVWVKEADRADEVFEKTVEILMRLQKHYWKIGKDEKADKILQLFFAIRTGKLSKSPEVSSIIGKVQDLSVERAPLAKLLAQSVEEDNDLIDRRLMMQGPLSAKFLLNTLFESGEARVRMKILELLRRIGSILPPLLVEKLNDPMPWYAKRNLLKLLSECGNQKDVPHIVDYLNHEDIRVQKEAFSCIHKLSGDDRKTNMLEALSLASGPMKEQVVRALIPFVDREIVDEVTSLVEDWRHFPEEVVESLLQQSFALLSRVAYKEAEEIIEAFLKGEGKKEAKRISAAVWQSAKDALRQIKLLQREESKKMILEASKTREKTFEATPAVDRLQEEKKVEPGKPKKRRTSFAEEGHIHEKLEEGDIARGKKLLVDLIEKAASGKQFAEAEKLREWLIEIDPSALNDIIRSAEIIENYKSDGISDDYLQVWSRLNDELSTEEYNTLYYAMDHRIYNEEEILVRQGDDTSALFFVNHGKVKLYFNEKSREVFVKNIMPGEVFGAETFFDASLWTISAAALTRSEVSVLPIKNIRNWGNEHPALESKLHDFCKQYKDIADAIKEQHRSRREHRRHQAAGDVITNILEQDEKDSGVQMKGELADISVGGLSFLVRISQRKNARILLGRKIRIQLPSSTERGRMLKVIGRLVSVRSLYSMNNEYSAHVKFTRSLTDQELRSVIEACKVA